MQSTGRLVRPRLPLLRRDLESARLDAADSQPEMGGISGAGFEIPDDSAPARLAQAHLISRSGSNHSRRIQNPVFQPPAERFSLKSSHVDIVCPAVGAKSRAVP
jgi:hypothetical protein